MGPIHNMLRAADNDVWRLGHTVVWQAIDEQYARGRCTACGREATATRHGGTITTSGEALSTTCTKDLVLKMPTLQRPSPRRKHPIPVATMSEAS